MVDLVTNMRCISFLGTTSLLQSHSINYDPTICVNLNLFHSHDTRNHESIYHLLGFTHEGVVIPFLVLVHLDDDFSSLILDDCSKTLFTFNGHIGVNVDDEDDILSFMFFSSILIFDLRYLFYLMFHHVISNFVARVIFLQVHYVVIFSLHVLTYVTFQVFMVISITDVLIGLGLTIFVILSILHVLINVLFIE